MTLMLRRDAQARLMEAGIKLSTPWLNVLCRTGKIPAVKFGKRWLIPSDAVEAIIRDLTSRADRDQAQG